MRETRIIWAAVLALALTALSLLATLFVPETAFIAMMAAVVTVGLLVLAMVVVPVEPRPRASPAVAVYPAPAPSTERFNQERPQTSTAGVLKDYKITSNTAGARDPTY